MLSIEVREGLTLDAGTWQNTTTQYGPAYLIQPPALSLFEQLKRWLSTQPKQPSGFLGIAEEAAGWWLFARYGTYLAVLGDANKPLLDSQQRQFDVSRISDGEMARINIEMSAAFTHLLKLKEHDEHGAYADLIRSAVDHLPRAAALPRGHNETTRLIQFGLFCTFAREWHRDSPERERVMGNSLANTCYRNYSPIENIHAGRYDPKVRSLTMRRFTDHEERKLARRAMDNLKAGISTWEMCNWAVRDGKPLEDYANIRSIEIAMCVPPHNWSLNDESREVTLHYGPQN